MATSSASSLTSLSSPAILSPTSTTSSSGSNHGSPTASSIAKTTNGIGSGAVAGIAIACVVVGIAIGAIVAFLILKRRHRQASRLRHVALDRHDRQERQDRQERREHRENHDNYQSAAKDDIVLGDFLLTQRSDKEIADELETLGQLIQQHTENNYHMHPVELDANASHQALGELGFESDDGVTSTQAIISLAQDPRTRPGAIQHIISRVVLNNFEPTSRSLYSMLPAYVLDFAHAIPPVERHRGSPDAVLTAFTRWRQLTAFLLNPRRSERGTLPPQPETLSSQAKQTAWALNNFLGPLVEPDQAQEQESHLQQVIMECGKFEYFLFSQPAQFRLHFPQGQTQGIVRLPALERTSDEQGNVLTVPQVVSRPQVEKL
ncbi:hypothetical protein BD289DRAFT_392123 [Coniella lustricola]|uniref:Uncharacterized protein n=1 Tax=Coniella lustricola TaxID=2025994 RepID=A0A2T3A473_9PEZI|nr:hypothetical protein BD289DRAFT_392123 [Coniella lustricola]